MSWFLELYGEDRQRLNAPPLPYDEDAGIPVSLPEGATYVRLLWLGGGGAAEGIRPGVRVHHGGPGSTAACEKRQD